jgi:hypothetical protein
MKSRLDQAASNPDTRLENAPDTTNGKIFGGKKTVIGQGNRSYNQFNDDPSIEDENKGSERLPANITVEQATQEITFPALAAKVVGSPDTSPGASTSSGKPISYTSSNTSVATIVNGKIHAIAPGSSSITASQGGDADYAAATSKVRSITITA